MISRWNKIDLHIHTDKSKETKDGDYSGDFVIDILLEKLTDNSVKLASLTDHNIINCMAYKEVVEKNSVTFLVGVELDILLNEEDLITYIESRYEGGDNVIEAKPFHIVMIFKNSDYAHISNLLERMYESISAEQLRGKIDLASQKKLRATTFKLLFSSFREEDFFIISHGNKTKGIVPPHIQADSLEDAQYSILMGDISALEMKSNRKLTNTIDRYTLGFRRLLGTEVSESLTSYVIFSDNHDCANYESPEVCTWLKGHLDYESLRIGFSDPESRIHTDRNMPKATPQYISNITICQNGKTENRLELSPYLNVIIGGRTSGKSFLFNTLIALNDLVQPEKKAVFNNDYSGLVDLDSTKVKLNLGSYGESFSLECESYCQESIIKLFANNSELKSCLKDHFHEFDKDEIREKEDIIESLFSDLKKAYEEYYSLQSEIEKGDRLQHVMKSTEVVEKLFEIAESELETGYQEHEFDSVITELEATIEVITNLQKIEFRSEVIFDYSEIEELNKSVAIISTKHLYYERNKNINTLKSIFFDKVKNINSDYIQSELTEEIQLVELSKKTLKQDIEDYKKYFKSKLKLRLVCDTIEKHEAKIDDKVNETTEYKFVSKIKFDINREFMLTEMFEANIYHYDPSTSIYRNLILMADPDYDDRRIKQVKGIEGKRPSILNKKIDVFLDRCKCKIDYEIIEKTDLFASTTSTSQGRKASMFLDIKLTSFLKDSTINILMIDQIEDNIDNKYVSEFLVPKLRRLKIKNQIILVTHNPSIAIYGDAENIILCDNSDDGIKYKQGGLENETTRAEACSILDGGDIAFQNRMQKYNIDKIKIFNNEVD